MVNQEDISIVKEYNIKNLYHRNLSTKIIDQDIFYNTEFEDHNQYYNIQEGKDTLRLDLKSDEDRNSYLK